MSDTKPDDSEAEDLIADDGVPVLELPLAERKEMRSAAMELVDADALDAIYGADTRPDENDPEDDGELHGDDEYDEG